MIKGQNITDLLVEQVARELKQPEELVEKIISHQFRSAAAAFKIHAEVEISGFGKFLISQSKLKRRQAKLTQIQGHIVNKLPSLQGKELDSAHKKLQSLEADIAYYNQRIQ